MSVALESRHGAPPAEANAPKPSLLKRAVSKGPFPSKPPPEPEAIVRDIDVNKVVDAGGTGREFTRGGEPGKKRLEKAQITESIDADVQTALRNHVVRLMTRVHPETLNDPRFKKDKILMEQITDGKGGVDDAKLNQFLNSDQGYGIAVGLLNDLAAVDRFALNVAVSALPPGQREMVFRDESMRTREMRGTMGRLISGDNVFGAFKDRTPFWSLGRQIKMENTAEVYRTVMGDGTTALPADANMITYIKELTGVDLNDYRVTAGRVEPRDPTGSRAIETGVSVKKMGVELRGLVMTRRNLLIKGFGVDEKVVDGTFDQWLVRGVREMTGTHLDQAAYDEFKARGGLVDAAGRNQSNPNFRVGGIIPVGLNNERNIRTWYEAHSVTLGRWMENYVEQLKTEGTEGSERITKLQELQTSLGPDGSRTQEAKGEFEKQKQALGGEKSTLTGTKEKMDEIKRLNEQATQERGKLESLLIRRFDHAIFGGGVWDPSRALAEISTVLSSTGGTITVDGRAITSPTTELARVNGLITTEINGLAGPATRARAETDRTYGERYDRAVAQVKAKYQSELADIEANRVLLTGLADTIKNSQDTIRTAEENVSLGKTEVHQLVEQVRALPSAFGKVTDASWVVPITIRGIPRTFRIQEADLQTMSVDDLMKRANEMYENGRKLTPPINAGWPKNRNENPDNRKLLLDAIAEAKARGADATGVITGTHTRFPDFQVLTNPAAWNISEYELMTLTDDQIDRLMTERDARSGGVLGRRPTRARPNPNFVDRAHIHEIARVARDRFNLRYNAVSGEITSRDTQIQQLEDKMQSIDFGKLKEKVDETLVMAGRQTDIFAAREKIVGDSDKYMSGAATLPASEVATPTETRLASATVPAGYFEMLDIFFGYKSQGTGREEAFKRARAFMPPERMAELLNNSFDLGFPPNPAIVDVLTRMQTRIKARPGTVPTDQTINAMDMRRGLSRIINTVVDETIIAKK